MFADFAWKSATPAFKQTNLIYGWNGCGKTTLTRLFDQISATDKTCEYQLENAGGDQFSQGDEYPFPVRVFNQDYISNNIRVLEGRANTISVLLGEENHDLAAQIDQDERLLNGDPAEPTDVGKVQELQKLVEQKNREERANDTEFTSLARTIGAVMVGTSSASRTYRAPDARRDFAALPGKAILADPILAADAGVLKQELLPTLDFIPGPKLTDQSGADLLAALPAVLVEAGLIAEASVETEVISRLKEYADLAEWVEAGVKLHALHDSQLCEYCSSPVPAARIAQLGRHFSEADRALRSRIDVVLSDLRASYAALDRSSAPDAARLYKELQDEFSGLALVFNHARGALQASAASLGKALVSKKLDTSAQIDLNTNLPLQPFKDALAGLNGLIRTHNAKSQEFEKVKRLALVRVRNHYLGTAYDAILKRQSLLQNLGPQISDRQSEIAEIRGRIAKARADISSAHKACEQINQSLASFLGRAELTFELDEQEVEGTKTIVGYRIMRGSEPALRLSEGEKTALAFTYFVVHLNDGQFRKSNGIVVIDDPISSMDSNSAYQAFAFLRKAVEGAKQVFILTHNFDFLKLLINWRHKAQKHTTYLMIKNEVVGVNRRALICEMDRELRTYASEYHYLFKRLKEMEAEQDGTIACAYPVPNLARKLWESFLIFSLPTGQTTYEKMQRLKNDGFDGQKLDAIYKFTNDQSHVTGGGFDPSLVPEAKNVIRNVFEMMETLSPDHYRLMEETVA